MSDIVKGIGDLFASVLEIIQGVITTIFNTVTGAIAAVYHAIIGIVSNIFNLAEGIVGLIIGNALIILVGVAAYFGYVQYQRSQGRNVQPITNKKLM